MTKNRAYTADEIIEAASRAHDPELWLVIDKFGSENDPAKIAALKRMRAALLVALRMSRVPTEAQCEAWKYLDDDFAIYTAGVDARIAEIEAGREEESLRLIIDADPEAWPVAIEWARSFPKSVKLCGFRRSEWEGHARRLKSGTVTIVIRAARRGTNPDGSPRTSEGTDK